MIWYIAAFTAGCFVGAYAALVYERFSQRSTWEDWQ